MVQLHLAGTSLRDIGRQFHVSRNAVRRIIRRRGAMPDATRKDKIRIDLVMRLAGTDCREAVRWLEHHLIRRG
ncbi:hypothetical protein FJY94_03490 [Candidatus Kaiserbacteria bacterium]|nr:hypothetical protein [Candidatus Kaiserbacteria bacterium]